MKKIFENKKILIGIIVLAVVLIALKVTDFNPFVTTKYGHFEKISEMNFPHAFHKTFLLKDGRVLILGNNLRLNTSEIYDPKTNKFTILKKFNENRPAYNAIMLDDGRILITGGYSEKSTPQKTLLLKSSLIYDSIKDEIINEGEMHFVRADHSNANLNNGKILIFGGYSGKTGKDAYVSKAELYNPKSNEFILLKSSPNFVYGKVANTSVLSDGRLFIINYLNKNNKAEIFDPKTNKFSVLNIPLTNDSDEFYYYLYKIVPLKNDRIVLFENDKDDFNNIKILDLKTNKLTNVGHMNLKDRGGYEVTLLKDENILITGGGVGRASFSKRVNSAEIFDTKKLKFYNVPKMKYNTNSSSTILLNDDRVLINGGSLGSACRPTKFSEIFIPNKNN